MIFRRGRKRAEEPDPSDQSPDEDLTEDVAEDQVPGAATGPGPRMGLARRRIDERSSRPTLTSMRRWMPEIGESRGRTTSKRPISRPTPRTIHRALTGEHGADWLRAPSSDCRWPRKPSKSSRNAGQRYSALELGAYAARAAALVGRAGDEIIESATEAGGSAAPSRDCPASCGDCCRPDARR
jgi:hypothetical protein